MDKNKRLIIKKQMDLLFKLVKMPLVTALLFFSMFDAVGKGLTYTVTDIKGTVLINKTDTLQIGVRITEEAEITFCSNSSVLELLNMQTKKFQVLMPLSQSAGEENYLTSIKEYFITTYNAMTRGDIEITTLKRFVDYYSNLRFLIFDENKIKVYIPELVIDSSNFFYISYVHKTNKENVKLDLIGETLCINKGVFVIDDEFFYPEGTISIKYYKSQEKESLTLVKTFNPVFLNDTEAIVDIRGRADALSSLQNSTPTQVVEALQSYINLNFGFIDKSNLLAWYSANYLK
ncbi:MAG: hypothetical protein DRI89_12755 [Bacteroidetes bacterium]|nr:MAG: hypothetical protein DRI89_12755 [Bacteroidota bacterium]